MSYKVTSTVWTENLVTGEYHQDYTVEATNLNKSDADGLAEELVDMWVLAESDPVTRFVNEVDHGAYVEGFRTAHGIRVTVLRQ